MKMVASSCLPFMPSYIISSPLEWNLCFVNNSPKTPNLFSRFKNAVQSPKVPSCAHPLPIMASIICPKVIREGSACGFIIISGRIPFLVNGMFASGITIPIVPF